MAVGMNSVVLMSLPDIASDEPAHRAARDEIRRIVLPCGKPRQGDNAGQGGCHNRNKLCMPVLVRDRRSDRPCPDGMPGWKPRAAIKEIPPVVGGIRPVSAGNWFQHRDDDQAVQQSFGPQYSDLARFGIV